jgi:multidrug efflux system membrane fusion protein
MKYITIIIAIAGICFFGCKSEQEPSSVKPNITVTHVKIHQIETIQESENIKVLGIVNSESEARPSFKTGGIISNSFVKEGDMVTKGQILATLEMDEINAQVKQAEEGLQKSLRDKNRVNNLFKDSVATLEQLQNVNTAYEVAKRTAEIANFNQKHSVVRSPITGKIIKQIMHAGEVVGPGNPIFAILGVGSKDWIVKSGLTDRDWARVNINDKVNITLDAYPGQVFKGSITEKSSVGGNNSGTFDVDIRFIDKPKNLAAGLIASISITSDRQEKFTVIPIEALVKSNGQSASVFTAQNGQAKIKHIKISKLLGDKVAVASGLEEVSNVITIGAMYLEDGDKIKH